MILVFGSINIDLVARVPSIPRPGETVLSRGYDMLFGGKGANQAVAASRAGRGNGVMVGMAARVGADEFGRAARANLEANGVSTLLVTTGPESTGCAFIAVEEGGENAITVASGANGALRAAGLTHAFGPADVLVLQMEVPFTESLAVARAARRGGARVIWNLAPAPADFARSDLAALLEASDILVVNEHEAAAAACLLGRDAGAAEEAAAAVAEGRGPVVVLTAGVRGALAHMPDGTRHRAEALAVQVVDTTGAGDTFVGLLAVEMVDHGELPLALRRACIGASLACARRGAQPGMPSRAELDAVSPPLDHRSPGRERRW